MRGTHYNKRQEIIRAAGWSLLDINRSGRADGARRLTPFTNLAECGTYGGGGDYIEGMSVYSGSKVILEL
jgi:hypothetical protein